MGKEYSQPEVIALEGIKMNRLTRMTEALGHQIYLSHKEFEILWLLLSYRGAIVRLKEIKEQLWRDPWSPMEGAVQCYVSRIREKLGRHLGALIQSVGVLGYKIEVSTLGKTPHPSADLTAV